MCLITTNCSRGFGDIFFRQNHVSANTRIMHLPRKVLTAISVLTLLIIAGVAAVKPPKGPWKNLQVLPEDISEEKLDSIMKSYNKALGEDCKFCHKPLETGSDKFDYASDSLPMKNNARDMIKMTININKTYFYHKKEERPEYLNMVHCNTCHRGEAFPPEPDEKTEGKKKKKH